METLIVKAVVIPWFYIKILKKTNANRDDEANIPHFYCLVISSVVLLTGFVISNCMTGMKILPLFILESP